MRNQLYVANLTESITAEDLEPLFSKFGAVEAIELGKDESLDTHYALVTMDAEKRATKALNGLNGESIGEKTLLISYPDLDTSKPLLSKQQKAAKAIAETLQETDKVPVRQIEMTVRLCGTSFAEAVLKEAQALFEGEGMLTQDGSRKRSLGGVFFQLVRIWTSPEVRHIIYNRKGKFFAPPEEDATENAEVEAEAATEE